MGGSWTIEAMPLKGILGHTHVCAYTCTCIHIHMHTHAFAHTHFLAPLIYVLCTTASEKLKKHK